MRTTYLVERILHSSRTMSLSSEVSQFLNGNSPQNIAETQVSPAHNIISRRIDPWSFKYHSTYQIKHIKYIIFGSKIPVLIILHIIRKIRLASLFWKRGTIYSPVTQLSGAGHQQLLRLTKGLFYEVVSWPDNNIIY